MTSNRPYLLRAVYEWIVDNGLTPHLVVDATAGEADLPLEYAQDGRIVLNVSPTAVQGLQLGNDWIGFSARFGGRPRSVGCAPSAVIAVYARENGQGMVFTTEEPEGEPPPEPESPPPGKPSLKVVK